jgi:hypothetical protein
MSKKLRTALDAAIMGYIKSFEKAHGVEFDWATNDDLTGMLCFGDHYFNMTDIVYDVDNKLPVKMIFEWQDAAIEAHFKGIKTKINLHSYAKGLRYDQVQ